MQTVFSRLQDVYKRQTPLLSLQSYHDKNGAKAEIVAKLEYFNPAGSVKDRVAFAKMCIRDRCRPRRGGACIN